MVKAAPPAPFIIAEAKFLLELLIIALDRPLSRQPWKPPVRTDWLPEGGGFELPVPLANESVSPAEREVP